MRIRTLASALAATLALSLPAGAQEAKKWTEIRIATEGAFEPWNFTKPDGSLDGYEVELSKILCERMQVKCTLSAQAFDGMIPALNVGKFDAVMAGMSITPKREEAIAFSISYGNSGQTFATLKSSPLAKMPHTGEVMSLDTDEAGVKKALEDMRALLKGKALGVQGSTIGLAFAEKYMKDMVEIKEYKTTDAHDMDLTSGRIDLTTASMAYLTKMVAKPENAEMVIIGPRVTGGVLGKGVGVGLRKTDPELKAMFDKAIEAAKADGTIAKLSTKWFGYDVTPR